jgi:hypothetical protein
MLGGAIANSINAAIDATGFAQTENFQSETGYISAMTPGRSAIVSVITMVIMLLLILTVGKFLWNNVLVSLIPAVKPAKSVWQILGLALLISFFQPVPQCC